MTFTFIDIFFLIIILAFAFIATIHGFIKEVFGKIAVIAGVFAGFCFCGLLAPSIGKIIHIPAVAIVLAFHFYHRIFDCQNNTDTFGTGIQRRDYEKLGSGFGIRLWCSGRNLNRQLHFDCSVRSDLV